MSTCDFKVIDYQGIRKIMKFEIRNLGLEFRKALSSFSNFSVEIGLKMGPVLISLGGLKLRF